MKSMTGYGRAQKITDGFEITVELKSVNHRFFEFSCRLPRLYAFLEEPVKACVQKRVNRGKIDCYLTILNTNEDAVEVNLDKAVLAAYMKALNEVREGCGFAGPLELRDITRFPEIFNVKKAQEDNEALSEAVLAVANAALDGFVEMRSREGEKLKTALANCLGNIKSCVSRIEQKSPECVVVFKEKLRERIKELTRGIELDEARLLTEAAVFADKTDVSEETVRLRSHISQFEKLVESCDSIGKKLDFIIQEMNREINTVGSKANDLELSHIVVEVKSQIEAMREQVQNIE